MSMTIQERDIPFEVSERDTVSFYRWSKKCLLFLCIFSQKIFSVTDKQGEKTEDLQDSSTSSAEVQFRKFPAELIA